MKKFVSICLCAFGLCLAALSSVRAEPAPPIVSAESAILVDAVTGKVLYEKRCRVRRPPASTTKMMTAILALENGELKDTVCASKDACDMQFSSLHLKPGEKMTLSDLLYGLLLRSGNDAAVCVAEHIGGSETKFVEMMNEKATEIGAKDTHFVNPHGLHHAKHYSTAYDLALIARYAIKTPIFNDIVQTKTARIERSMNPKDAYLKNTARFLWRFDGADGIKTGYTKEAGHCFVGSATRGAWRLIAVALKSEEAGADTEALLNYGFKHFKQVCFARTNEVLTTAAVSGGVTDKVGLVPEKDLSLVLKQSAKAETKTDIAAGEVHAPVTKGEKLGTLTGYLNGEKIGCVDLLAAQSVDRTLVATVWFWARPTLITCMAFLVGFISYGTAVAKAARRRRRSLASRC
ncbi:MAG TPA: D-alanyl-D-alanine carboxypeptidase family protein [Armatimonadota bacterium]|nr:D-alanyl-D-alanine carboxypeptidase family protein [Armatimonadota bacterium]